MKTVMKFTTAVMAFAMLFSNLMFATGASDFSAKCAACHGASGAGDTAMGKTMKLRDLGSAEVQSQSDAELTSTIANGKGKMPKFDGKLTKEQIDDMVKFIRTLKK
jgi:mono/diheme cytochrome c family protein